MSAASPPWWNLRALWVRATAVQRCSTLLPPLIVPASLFTDHAFFPMLVSAGVLVGCAVVAFGRLCALPFRRGRESRLLAWRLPLSTLLAVAVLSFGFLAVDAATIQLHERMVDLKENGRWPCGDADRCRIDVGRAPVWYVAYLDRDVRPDDTAAYEAKFMPFQDSWIVFQLHADGRLEGWSKADVESKPIDLAAL